MKRNICLLLMIITLTPQVFSQPKTLKDWISFAKKDSAEIIKHYELNGYFKMDVIKNSLADTLYFNKIFPFGPSTTFIYPKGIKNKNYIEISTDISDTISFTKMIKEVEKSGFKFIQYFRTDASKWPDYVDINSVKRIINTWEYSKGNEHIEFDLEEKTIMMPSITFMNGEQFKHKDLSFVNYYTFRYVKK